MADEGLGGLAKKWLRNKAKELTTTNRRERETAAYEAERNERDMKSEAVGEALMTAVPGLRKWRDQQEEHRRAADEAREAEFQAELAARPVGRLELHLSGAMTGTWRGTVPSLVQVRPPDPEAWAEDPYRGQPTLVVDLGPVSDPTAPPGSKWINNWHFEVPGFAGPGRYDLAESGMRRRDADAEPEYIEWELGFGDDQERFYFQPDIGPSAVTVDAPITRVEVQMAMTGDAGQVEVRAVLQLPPPPAA